MQATITNKTHSLVQEVVLVSVEGHRSHTHRGFLKNKETKRKEKEREKNEIIRQSIHKQTNATVKTAKYFILRHLISTVHYTLTAHQTSHQK